MKECKFEISKVSASKLKKIFLNKIQATDSLNFSADDVHGLKVKIVQLSVLKKIVTKTQ